MDSEYNVNGMSSINVGSELQEDEDRQFAALNLHMDRHQHHQYPLIVPDLYSFDPATDSPANLLMIGPTFAGNTNNSNTSEPSSPIYSTAADQSHLLQCAVEGLIDICTAAKLDCNEALSSSTPAEFPENHIRAAANVENPIPGINNVAMSPTGPALNNHNAQAADNNTSSDCSGRDNPTAAMREMIFRVAAMQPIHIDPESIKRPKRKNVRISEHPQSVAARHRRERISERIRILQRLVPGGTRMDTASMLDEAIHYVKFLKMQVQALQSAGRGGGGCARCSFNNNSYWFGLPNCNGSNPNCGDAVFPNSFLMAESRAYNNNNNCSLS